MTSNEIIHKNYTNNNNIYQLVLPIDVGILIPEDDSVRLLSQILEELDYTKLMKAYSSRGRNSAVTPKNLFKVMVYAYMNDLFATRKIEEACKRDINFIWLLQGEKAPDHNTIARFRTERLADIVEELFNQFVNKLGELGEVQYKNLFIDGTKIEAYANKYSFVWKGAIAKHEVKLQEKIKKLINEINTEFKTSYINSESKIEVNKLQEVLNFLNKKKIELNVEFTYGKGKRKTKIQKLMESLEEHIEKQTKYDDFNATFNGRNSFSKTDKDATFMHLKEDHMRNSQLKPAYNVQIGVEAEYIVGIDISSERSDQLTFIPFLEKLNENLPQKYENVTADAGYESEENYVFLEENNQKSFIKPQAYEGMKKKNFKKDISKRENMDYDKEKDEYTCNNNKKLKPVGTKIRKSKSGYQAELVVYECESCEGCQLKPKCTKAKGNRQIQVSKKFIELRQKSIENITSNDGILLRMNRSIQVEGTFGVLKEDRGFRRFLTRGKKNVKTEFILLCFGYNMSKLHNKIQNNRCGIPLHAKKVS